MNNFINVVNVSGNGTNMHSVGAIIPSFKDDKGLWRRYLLEEHLPSYVNISNIDDITFSYNLQNYTDDEFNEAVTAIKNTMKLNPTWDAFIQRRSKYNEGLQTPVSMARVRYDTAMAVYFCKIFLYLDDDVVFHDRAGYKYKDIIDYMNYFPNCGAIMSAGFLGGYNYLDRIKLSYNKLMWTNRGLFIRNITETTGHLLYNQRYLDYPGGYEDLTPILELSKFGYYLGTSFNNNTYHRARGTDEGRIKSSKKEKRYSAEDNICDTNYSIKSLYNYLYKEFGITHTNPNVSSFYKFMNIIYEEYYKKSCINGINAYSCLSRYEVDIKLMR